jgi:hypothetical protein
MDVVESVALVSLFEGAVSNSLSRPIFGDGFTKEAVNLTIRNASGDEVKRLIARL